MADGKIDFRNVIPSIEFKKRRRLYHLHPKKIQTQKNDKEN
jgi:hypothetical protein